MDGWSVSTSSTRSSRRRRRSSWSTMRIVIVQKAASLPLRSSRNVKMTEKNEIHVVEIYVDCYMSGYGICQKFGFFNFENFEILENFEL